MGARFSNAQLISAESFSVEKKMFLSTISVVGTFT